MTIRRSLGNEVAYTIVFVGGGLSSVGAIALYTSEQQIPHGRILVHLAYAGGRHIAFAYSRHHLPDLEAGSFGRFNDRTNTRSGDNFRSLRAFSDAPSTIFALRPSTGVVLATGSSFNDGKPGFCIAHSKALEHIIGIRDGIIAICINAGNLGRSV